MRRMLSSGAAALPLAALLLGPWLGMATIATPPSPVRLPAAGAVYVEDIAPRPARAAASFERRVGGCNCRTVEVNLRNVVRRTKVTTGHAKVVNYNVTYVSAAFTGGDREVDVDQQAYARSGDAVAGQLIDVNAMGPGCVNVIVNATNDVEDATVRSGDATAVNRSIVLLDPGVHQGDLEIDIEQVAVARSGRAIAGQVMSITGGPKRGRCGGRVDLHADNRVADTKVVTGRARTDNDARVITCDEVGCASELRRLLGVAEDVQVCAEDGCDDMDVDELGATLASEATRPSDEDDEEDDEDAELPERVAPARCGPRPTPSPQPAPTPADSAEEAMSPAPTAGPEESAPPTPPPPPSPTPRACEPPPPSPTPSPQLLASDEETDPES